MIYTVTVTDATGQVLGTTTESTSGAGTSSLLLDLRAKAAHYGTFTFAASGQRAVSDPDTLDSSRCSVASSCSKSLRPGASRDKTNEPRLQPKAGLVVSPSPSTRPRR
jgi:hypothetical protein